MKLEQIFFVKEAYSFIMKKQDNFLIEVVSFTKTKDVSPKLTTSVVGLFFMPVGSFPLN